jgi:putative polyhydroxyalkanoate system protein
MASIHIQRAHELPLQTLRADIAALAETLQEQLQAEFIWEDDETLSFARKGASGRIHVDARQIDVEIDLGLMLKPLRGRVEQAVNEYLDEHLGPSAQSTSSSIA